MKKTKKAYEEYLNELASGTYSWDELMDRFGYLRPRASCLLNKLKLGTALRKYDSIAFEVGFREWETQEEEMGVVL